MLRRAASSYLASPVAAARPSQTLLKANEPIGTATIA